MRGDFGQHRIPMPPTSETLCYSGPAREDHFPSNGLWGTSGFVRITEADLGWGFCRIDWPARNGQARFRLRNDQSAPDQGSEEKPVHAHGDSLRDGPTGVGRAPHDRGMSTQASAVCGRLAVAELSRVGMRGSDHDRAIRARPMELWGKLLPGHGSVKLKRWAGVGSPCPTGLAISLCPRAERPNPCQPLQEAASRSVGVAARHDPRHTSIP